jgi:REP element-mobilizing transposase RayT
MGAQRPLTKPARPDALDRFRRRNLPHWEVAGASYFITFRLAGSLPAHVVQEWRLERERLRSEERVETGEDADMRRRAALMHAKFDAQLDAAGDGPTHLRDPGLAQLVIDAVRFYATIRYDLYAYVVMPNHMHLVLRPLPKNASEQTWGLDEIMHGIKGFTGKQANELLNQSGPFWQREYYDRLIRDDAEWAWYVEYTLHNPVAAGLCSEPVAWPWSNAPAFGL